MGRGGEKENEETGETNPGLSTLQTPPQGTWGTMSSARTFSSTSTSVPRCPGFSPPVAPLHCSPAALLHLGQRGLLRGRETRCRHCVERRLRKSLSHALPSSSTLVRTDHISADSQPGLCFQHAVISRLIQQKRQCH